VHFNLTHSVAEQLGWKIGCLALQFEAGTHWLRENKSSLILQTASIMNQEEGL
jgi:hypothetical protein